MVDNSDTLFNNQIPEWMEKLNHKFNPDNLKEYQNDRCSKCGIQYEYLITIHRDMTYHSPKRFEREYTCGFDIEKYENEQKSKHKIKKIDLSDFKKILVEFDRQELEQEPRGMKFIHSFNKIYKWFWDNKKISRWSVEAMFNDLVNNNDLGFRSYGASFPKSDDIPCYINGKRHYVWRLKEPTNS